MGGPSRRGAESTDPSERAREIALRILAGAPRSEAQLREGLTSRDVSESIADEVIDRYREVGLLDDAGLSAAIARTRHAERGHSRRAIAVELRRKGFDGSDVEAALAQVSEEDERATAEKLARERWATLSGTPREARLRRVASYLGRKGYAAGLAYELVRGLDRADILGGREVNPAEEEVS